MSMSKEYEEFQLEQELMQQSAINYMESVYIFVFKYKWQKLHLWYLAMHSNCKSGLK